MKKVMNNKGLGVKMIVMAIMGVSLVAVVLLDQLVMRCIVAGVSLALTSLALLCEWARKRMDFMGSVQEHLQHAGYKCKMQDDDILVKRGELVLRAKVWNRPEKGSKRIHFTFDFAPAKLDCMSQEGWALLTAMSNANSTYTTVKFYGDHMSCQVETTVKTAKDFVRESEFAFEKICESLQALEQNTPKLVKQFGKSAERHVGFRVPVAEMVDEGPEDEAVSDQEVDAA